MSASTSRRRLITNQCRNHTETKRIHRVESAASAAGCKSMTAAECINKQREQRGIKTPNCCSDIASRQRPRPAQTPTHGDGDENRSQVLTQRQRTPRLLVPIKSTQTGRRQRDQGPNSPLASSMVSPGDQWRSAITRQCLDSNRNT